MAASNPDPPIPRPVRALLLVALGVVIVPPASASAFVAKGKVRYAYQACANAEANDFAGLSGARIVLRDAKTKRIVEETQTDATGRFSVEVNSREVTASVTLDSAGKFTVSRRGAHPYGFRLGTLTRKDPSKSVAFATSDKSGAMNIFNALGVGAQVAGDLATEAGPVTAVWNPDRDLKTNVDLPGAGAWYNPATRQLIVDGNGPRLGEEWDPWVVLHEYGHHILISLHAVGGKDTTAGPHFGNQAYRDAPALAWGEGFADAFGTLAQDSSPLYGVDPGVARRNCGDFMNLGSSPPQPTPPADLPQFNETAGASVIWGLSELIGGGPDLHLRAAGLRSLVRIARGFYRPPEDMYDVRAALTSVPGIEETPADHERIDQIFGARGHMGWGKSVEFVPTEISEGAPQLHLRLEGPQGYEECAVTYSSETFSMQGTGEGPYLGSTVPGGLNYTWQDDCLIWSADAAIEGPPESPEPGTINGRLLMDFPFLGAGAQRSGNFKLYATWLCRDIPPTEDYPGSFCDLSAPYFVLVCLPVNPSWFDPCSHVPVGSTEAPLNLERNGPEKLVLEFSADGQECLIYHGGAIADCTTGKAWQ